MAAFLSLFDRKPPADHSRLQFGEVSVDIIQKKVKNLRLSVHAPEGRVRLSAPASMSLEAIQVFITTRLDWIRKQQLKLRSQVREPRREYSDGESHYFKGRLYALRVTERNAPPRVKLGDHTLELSHRPSSSRSKRQSILHEWYRAELKRALPEIIAKYEILMGVKVAEFGVKRMKTRWGTCNPVAQRIWLNLELAKQPAQCLEYVVVHEMTHLLERSHNQRFTRLMDQFMPHWRQRKAELNQAAQNYQA